MWVWQPAPDLAPAVATLWATEAQTVAFRERVLPGTTVELMINFGGRQTVHPTGGASPQHFLREGLRRARRIAPAAARAALQPRLPRVHRRDASEFLATRDPSSQAMLVE